MCQNKVSSADSALRQNKGSRADDFIMNSLVLIPEARIFGVEWGWGLGGEFFHFQF